MRAKDKPLTIGDVSRMSGCRVPTIRYYEAIGLLPPAPRRPSGHRFYSSAVADRLRFIRHCRDFGFSIEQLRDLLAIADDGSRYCVEPRGIAQARLDLVRVKQRPNVRFFRIWGRAVRLRGNARPTVSAAEP